MEKHLAAAIEEGDVEEVASLLRAQENRKAINWAEEDEFGQSLLHRAAELGNLAIIQFILAQIGSEALWAITCADRIQSPRR